MWGNIMEERINIVMMDLPGSIKGFVVQTMDDNGEPFYTVCINSNLCEEVQFRTMRHEFAHIVNGDFVAETAINIIEEQRARAFA